MIIPANFSIPANIITNGFLITTPQVEDAPLIYAALKESADLLKLISSGSFSFERYSQTDLGKEIEYSLSQHNLNKTLYYVIYNEKSTCCLGEMYLSALAPFLKGQRIMENNCPDEGNHPVIVSYWLRTSVSEDEELTIFKSIKQWIERDFGFSLVTFKTRTDQHQRINVLDHCAMKKIYVLDIPNQGAKALLYASINDDRAIILKRYNID